MESVGAAFGAFGIAAHERVTLDTLLDILTRDPADVVAAGCMTLADAREFCTWFTADADGKLSVSELCTSISWALSEPCVNSSPLPPTPPSSSVIESTRPTTRSDVSASERAARAELQSILGLCSQRSAASTMSSLSTRRGLTDRLSSCSSNQTDVTTNSHESNAVSALSPDRAGGKSWRWSESESSARDWAGGGKSTCRSDTERSACDWAADEESTCRSESEEMAVSARSAEQPTPTMAAGASVAGDMIVSGGGSMARGTDIVGGTGIACGATIACAIRGDTVDGLATDIALLSGHSQLLDHSQLLEQLLPDNSQLPELLLDEVELRAEARALHARAVEERAAEGTAAERAVAQRAAAAVAAMADGSDDESDDANWSGAAEAAEAAVDATLLGMHVALHDGVKADESALYDIMRLEALEMPWEVQVDSQAAGGAGGQRALVEESTLNMTLNGHRHSGERLRVGEDERRCRRDSLGSA